MTGSRLRATFAHALVLVLLIVLGATLSSLRAQGHPPEPAPNEPPPKEQPQPDNSAQTRGPGGELVHESNEAAGEEKDQMAEFKESASVRLIARVTGLSLQQSYWLSIVLNFAVIAVVIIWAGVKFLPGIFRGRSQGIQKAMQEAQIASQEARRRLADIESRLMKLDVEIGMMRDAAEREGAAEEARIRVATEEDARKIVASAEQEIAAAVKAARRNLTAYAADLAVGLASRQIRVNAATDQALIRNFAGQLASTDDSGKGRN